MAQRHFEDVSVGDEIPPVTERVNTTQLFFFSAATYNGHRIHYDLPYAQSEGHPTLLVHGPLQSALMAKTLRDWAGPRGRLLRLNTQNRASAYPDEDLIFTGRVTSVRQEEDGGIVECEVWEQKEDGRVIMPGSATVQLPLRPN
ncbi:MAG: MaoC family dehydratase N-terminal domain-containing protein [Dehalococcoidia bacterium]